VEQQIGKHNYRLRLPATIRLHYVFHVNNPRLCSTEPLRLVVPVTVLEGDDDEFKVSHISAMCIKSLHGRRRKYLQIMTHFSDDDIPHVWHRLNEVYRTTASQEFLETPEWHKFAKTHYMIVCMYSLLIPVRAFPSERRTTWVRRYCNFARVLMRTILLVPPGTYMKSWTHI
jgi:hypothetical protein